LAGRKDIKYNKKSCEESSDILTKLNKYAQTEKERMKCRLYREFLR